MSDEPRQLTTTTTVSNPSPLDTTFWVAQQLQAGIWAVFLSAILLVMFSRRRIAQALEAHFRLMKEMEIGVKASADAQLSNANTQKKLVSILRKMEATDTITKADITHIKKTLSEVLGYVSNNNARLMRRPSVATRYLEPISGELDDKPTEHGQ